MFLTRAYTSIPFSPFCSSFVVLVALVCLHHNNKKKLKKKKKNWGEIGDCSICRVVAAITSVLLLPRRMLLPVVFVP